MGSSLLVRGSSPVAYEDIEQEEEPDAHDGRGAGGAEEGHEVVGSEDGEVHVRDEADQAVGGDHEHRPARVACAPCCYGAREAGCSRWARAHPRILRKTEKQESSQKKQWNKHVSTCRMALPIRGVPACVALPSSCPGAAALGENWRTPSLLVFIPNHLVCPVLVPLLNRKSSSRAAQLAARRIGTPSWDELDAETNWHKSYLESEERRCPRVATCPRTTA